MQVHEGRGRVSLVLVFALLFGLLMPAMADGAEAVQFKDTADSYAKQEIQELARDGIVNGYEDGTFQPNQTMTRAELAKIIVLSQGLNEKAEEAAAFTDVAPDAWYRGYVGALVASGITQGTSPTTFSPGKKVTREDLVVFFIRALGLEQEAKQTAPAAGLSDLQDASSWARAHISLAFQIGFVNGISHPDGRLTFNPKDQAERQALARLAYEFKAHGKELVAKAKQLVHKEESFVKALSVADNVTVEVTFMKEPLSASASDFTFDQGLKVEKAELKKGDPFTVLLTTTAQTADKVYSLTYKGKPTGLTFKGKAAALFGGGGGGGGAAPTKPLTDLEKLNRGGTYDSLTITASGTLGPADGAEATAISGVLTLDPGANGEITLQNVKANQIVVASGSSNSIKLKNTIITTLRVSAANQSNPVRIETLSGANVSNTDIQSKAIIESTAGSLGMIKLGAGTEGQEIELRGTLQGPITVQGEGARITLARPQASGAVTIVASLQLAANAKVSAPDGTSLTDVNIVAPNAKIAVEGTGSIGSVTVSPEGQGATLDLKNSNIASVHLKASIKLEGDPTVIGRIKINRDPGIIVQAAETLIEKLKELAEAAIAAIPDFNSYSAEVDARIAAADTLAFNAITVGTNAEELVGYSTKLAVAKARITTFALEESSQELSIGLADGDTLLTVTQTLGLPAKDAARGVDIWWLSSDTATVAVDGKITRPANGSGDAVVTLTAVLSKNGREISKELKVTVLAQGQLAPIRLSIEPYNIIFQVYGDSRQLEVFAHYSNESVLRVTDEAVFSSSNPSVAKVSAAGLLTPVGNGTAVVTAHYKNISSTTAVTVDYVNELPKAPVVKAEPGNEQVTLSWDAVGSNVTYQVYSSTTSGWYSFAPATVTDTTYTVRGLKNGQTYYFKVAAVHGGQSYLSQEISAVPGQRKTATPVVSGAVYTYGWKLSGTAEPDASVQLYKKDGTFLAYAYSGYNGHFSMTNEFERYSSHLQVGEELYLTARYGNDSPSDPERIFVQTTVGQTTRPTVTGNVYDRGQLQGKAEPGSTVVLYVYGSINPSYTQASSVDGSFTFSAGNFTVGKTITLKATTFGKATSEGLTLVIQSAPKAVISSVTGAVYTNGWKLQGQVQINGNQSGSLELRGKDSAYLGFRYVQGDGSFVWSEFNRYTTLRAGDQVQLTANVDGMHTSEPFKFTVQLPSVSTPVPVVEDVYELSNLRGYTEPGAQITLRIGDSAYVTTTTASEIDGSFIFSTNGSYSAGTKLSLTSVAIGKTVSEAVYVTIQSSPKTALSSVTGIVYTNGWRISGVSETTSIDFGYTKIELTTTSGAYVASTTEVTKDGAFQLEWNQDQYFQRTLVAGEELLLTARVTGKMPSEPVSFKVLATTDKLEKPTVTGDVYELQSLIHGKTAPGAVVMLKYKDNYRSSTKADSNGDFSLYTPWTAEIGTKVELTASVIGKTVSDAVYLTVQAMPQTALPSVTGAIYTSGYMFSGTAEPSTSDGFTEVRLTWKDGTHLAYTNVETNGQFSFSSFSDYFKGFELGREVVLTAKAPGKKTSESISFIVQPDAGQTDPVMTELVNDEVIRGRAPFGALVRITVEASGYIHFVKAIDGTFVFSSAGWVTAGDRVSITATNIGKRMSEPVTVTIEGAPITQIPTVSGSVYFNGLSLTGQTEKPMGQQWDRVILSKQSGEIVSITGIEEDGTYYMNEVWQIYPPITAGEVLFLSARVYGKKESLPVQVVVQPIMGETAAPTIVTSNEATISGYAEPGASVRIFRDQVARIETASSYNGYFEANYFESNVLPVGEKLTIIATTLGKASSAPVQVVVEAAEQTATPVVTGAVYSNAFNLSGTVDAGEKSGYILLNKLAGSYIYSNYSWGNKFNMKGIVNPYSPMLVPGEEVQLTAQVFGKKTSDPITLVVQPVSGQTAVPTIVEEESGLPIFKGKAEPGAILILKNNTRLFFETIVADEQGDYQLSYSTRYFKPGDQLTLTATTPGKATSDQVHITLVGTP
ncbi:Fibronectin type III domain-containing protein [Paenibacillus sp. UNCCL117]|uniref:S-layer homology domain-containing protein n=1 Tax=unclassified Paenibacillus TaxID=185978 RepID=UPI000891F045|nr:MULTISPECIES: S-layer homology domain-containing protein [unclassified Paenibacillus]SDE48845.1 Fibronectin type III domain-containing protein [Paenibacillus sp. cl123]SFW66755.1 Fibronectin type III domain-containing protein [Paenibacillus sp. UNCCL117]